LFGQLCEKPNVIFQNNYFIKDGRGMGKIKDGRGMGKINDNDFIPILKAFNLQGFEKHIKCLKN
jgi:hypothetical protein